MSVFPINNWMGVVEDVLMIWSACTQELYVYKHHVLHSNVSLLMNVADVPLDKSVSTMGPVVTKNHVLKHTNVLS